MNTSDDSRMLKKGTVIGVMKAASQVNSEDTKYDALRLGINRDPARNTSGDTPLEQSRIKMSQCEHIAPLFKNDIASDITHAQRTQLQKALVDFADAFSSRPEDIGLTDYIEHMIDTNDSRPIRLPPPWLPISKRECEITEVNNMLKYCVIETS